ncbi:hypothetical protein ACH5RR_021049 [Cinchona calisaya]|uniref:Uncharacterized protein n=1 Tax=Cinchona calisaya TaxID=153742 RepID=A0ABD2ZJP0_9GENT
MSKAHASEESSSKDLVEEEDEKQKKSKENNHEEDECKTPLLSQEQRIPAPQSCPPAPKKRKRRGRVLRKRKLSKLEFFENTGKEEVDSFFQSSSHEISTTTSPVAPETKETSTATSKNKKRRKNPRN